MGKSIRSKIKRKHRAEFRATIGTEAHKKQMAVVQEKLKKCIEKGASRNSFDRISSLLETDTAETETGTESMDAVPVDPVEAAGADVKGENKVPVKKRRKGKHKLLKKGTGDRMDVEKQPRPKPRFFCQF